MLVRSALVDRTFWIGGGTCAGKSTITKAVCTRRGLIPYHADDHWEKHIERAEVAEHPYLRRLGSMSPGDWFLRPHDQGIADELAGLQEEVGLAIEDLGRIDTDAQILAEGTLFLPESLKALGVRKNRAIWLIPTPDFQRSKSQGRGGWVNEVLAQYEDPAAAWETWIRRDAVIAGRIRDSAARAGYTWVNVDGNREIEELVQRVEGYFFSQPSTGSSA